LTEENEGGKRVVGARKGIKQTGREVYVLCVSDARGVKSICWSNVRRNDSSRCRKCMRKRRRRYNI